MVAISEKKPSYIIKLALTVLIPIIICLIPVGELFTAQIKVFIACTLFGILMFVFEQVNTTVAAILLCMSYYVFGVAPLNVIFSTWTENFIWTAMGVLLLVSIANDTHLFRRLAYKILVILGNGYGGIMLSVGIIAVLIRLLLGATSAIVPVILIAISICHACGFKRDKYSAGIVMGALVTVGNMDYFIYSPDYFALLANNFAKVIPSMQLNHVIMLKYNWTFFVGIIVLLFIVCKICGRGCKHISRDEFKELQKQLPPMDAREKKLLVALVFILVYCFTINLHHQPMIYAFLLVPLFLCLPIVNVGTAENVKNTNFPFLFFITGCQAIGVVGNYAGIAQFVSTIVTPHVSGMSMSVFVASIWWFTFLMNFLMTPLAEMSAFAVPVAQICVDMGFNPYPVMYSFFNGITNIVLPYESAFPLLVYGFGYVRMKDWAIFCSAKALFDFVWLVTIAQLYWNVIGLM